MPTLPPRPLHNFWIYLIVTSLSTWAVFTLTSLSSPYGYGLFLGIPTAMGLLIAFLYQHGRLWKWREVLVMTLFCMILTTLALLICKIEGMVCILMAAILVSSMVLIGLIISWSIRALTRQKKHGTRLHCFVLLSFPLLIKLEATQPLTPHLVAQTTVIEITAPPEIVWNYVPAFPAITNPPDDWITRSLAYPIRSEIDGTGVGAIRRCVLSTGMMPEVVTQWEPGKLLEFVVIDTPPTMIEQNPFGQVESAHVKGYFQAKRGSFKLTALPNGRTRVEGTSWFSQNFWPRWYWEPIAMHTVSGVHQRVLEHIKALAEKENRSSPRFK